MHASPSAACCSAHSSSSQPPAPSLGAAPVSRAVQSASCPTSASSPQCCHCGWRGAHAPTCPFK
ncbi:hypothetical protein BD309DRAFT_858708 [Dichomitus squalens]|uniref:Uncharacterized protein n=1 Tax=Dichomitus squalens TaxID=114155 RepID=A0A4Q9Q5F8_9APHY|nr:uncharacterized protein DICSQDRAFT_48381 [Dichomitus squalens LYAD-421 SS1]EJF67311.1 hypothetical protein DICSQDRAFT_48381 [Dichomitus squalens LYAD-421 SS1]TBU29773.1 hypothetical protein BD311DRAFT_755681 [Dichomitus squalens]TBU46138.1 hypothetical protein BD309DRAFT_858708 [Dichomitus squalens]TBU62515.1 hypothetical protein BD310DRAFT_918567 [Dichomitus squalens]